MNNLVIDDTVFNWFLRAFFTTQLDQNVFIYDKEILGFLGLKEISKENYVPLLRNQNIYDGVNSKQIDSIINNYVRYKGLTVIVSVIDESERLWLLKSIDSSDTSSIVSKIDIGNFGVRTVKEIGSLLGWKAGVDFERKLHSLVYDRINTFINENEIPNTAKVYW